MEGWEKGWNLGARQKRVVKTGVVIVDGRISRAVREGGAIAQTRLMGSA